MAKGYREREADGNVKTMTMPEVMVYMAEGGHVAYGLALEGHQIIDAARSGEDLHVVEMLVKWQTLPNWKRLMEAEGYEFDLKLMRWHEPGTPASRKS